MRDQLSGLRKPKKQNKHISKEENEITSAGLSCSINICVVHQSTSTHPRLCCTQEQCSGLGFADLLTNRRIT